MDFEADPSGATEDPKRTKAAGCSILVAKGVSKELSACEALQGSRPHPCTSA